MNIQKKTDEEIFFLDIISLRQRITDVSISVSSELLYVFSVANDMSAESKALSMDFFRHIPHMNPDLYKEYISLLGAYKKCDAAEYKKSVLLSKTISKMKHFFVDDNPVGPEFLSQILDDNVHGKSYEAYCALLYDLATKNPDVLTLLEQALFVTYPRKKIEINNYLRQFYLKDIQNSYTLLVFLKKLLQHDLPLNISKMRDDDKKIDIMCKFLYTMDIDDLLYQKMTEAKAYVEGRVILRRVSISSILPDEKDHFPAVTIGHPVKRPSLDYYDNRRDRYGSGELVGHEGQFIATKVYNSIDYANYLRDHQED